MPPDVEALAAAKRIVEEVLAEHAQRSRGGPDAPSDVPRPDHTEADADDPGSGTDDASRTPPAAPGATSTDPSRSVGDVPDTPLDDAGDRPETSAGRAARRIVEEVLADHAARGSSAPEPASAGRAPSSASDAVVDDETASAAVTPGAAPDRDGRDDDVRGGRATAHEADGGDDDVHDDLFGHVEPQPRPSTTSRSSSQSVTPRDAAPAVTSGDASVPADRGRVDEGRDDEGHDESGPVLGSTADASRAEDPTGDEPSDESPAAAARRIVAQVMSEHAGPPPPPTMSAPPEHDRVTPRSDSDDLFPRRPAPEDDRDPLVAVFPDELFSVPAAPPSAPSTGPDPDRVGADTPVEDAPTPDPGDDADASGREPELLFGTADAEPRVVDAPAAEPDTTEPEVQRSEVGESTAPEPMAPESTGPEPAPPEPTESDPAPPESTDPEPSASESDVSASDDLDDDPGPPPLPSAAVRAAAMHAADRAATEPVRATEPAPAVEPVVHQDPTAPSAVAARIVADVLAARAHADAEREHDEPAEDAVDTSMHDPSDAVSDTDLEATSVIEDAPGDEPDVADTDTTQVDDARAGAEEDVTDELVAGTDDEFGDDPGAAIVRDARSELDFEMSEASDLDVYADEHVPGSGPMERAVARDPLAASDDAATEEMAIPPGPDEDRVAFGAGPVAGMPTGPAGTDEPWTDEPWTDESWSDEPSPDDVWADDAWSAEQWPTDQGIDATDARGDVEVEREARETRPPAIADDLPAPDGPPRLGVRSDDPTLPAMPDATRPPKRTGRWLLTTILGAIALALLFPLAVGALMDLVSLS